MHQLPDDTTVIQMVLQGRDASYAILVDRYSQFVFTLAMRYVNDREVAEELAQDVFVKTYKCLADFKGSCKFSTWLYTIVNTTCLSYLRRKKDETVFVEEDKLVTLSDAFNVVNPGTKLEQLEQKRILGQAIKKLPSDEAMILSYYYNASQSVEEIGMITGLTTANVKIKLFRARQKLKEILTPVLREA